MSATSSRAETDAIYEYLAQQWSTFGLVYVHMVLANPTLVQKLETNAELAPTDMSTWFTPGAEGYLV